MAENVRDLRIPRWTSANKRKQHRFDEEQSACGSVAVWSRAFALGISSNGINLHLRNKFAIPRCSRTKVTSWLN